MLTGERDVGGLRCSEVLAALGDYADGDLAPAMVARIHDHLRGCDLCERFGQQYSDLLAVLYRDVAAAGPIDAGVGRRLRARLGIG